MQRLSSISDNALRFDVLHPDAIVAMMMMMLLT
jgi:hypothetical protein